MAGAVWMPWLTLRRSDPRPLPGDEWLRVRPTLAGICGTDLALLTGRASAVMSPFVSFPGVLGHEAVGTVEEIGPSVAGLQFGNRVVVDPVISCEVRGLQPCRECVDGHPSTCLRAADGPLSPGLLIGYCRDLPGAWGDEMLVHRSQAYAVPASIPDEAALLVEPLSVALHAVLRDAPPPGARVLVIGGGALGLLVLASLRMLGSQAETVCVARHPLQARWAERLGAGRIVGDEAGAAAAGGARAHRTLMGGTAYTDGYDVVYDCAGTRDSVDLALRIAGPRGRVVNVGGPGVLGRLDLTASWVRELRVEGTYVYGREPSLDGSPHTFAVALRLLEEHADLELGALVTHRFGLEEWRRAMAAALDRRQSGALKVAFELGR